MKFIVSVALGKKDRNRLNKEMKAFLEGKTKKIGLKIFPRGTDFQKKVWRAIQKIPYGQTRSYAWIARQIGKPKAMRAVGQACGANPLPLIIPCHRVVASNGKIGGFTGGLFWKKRLLALESHSI